MISAGAGAHASEQPRLSMRSRGESLARIFRSGSLIDNTRVFHKAQDPFSWQGRLMITGPALFSAVGCLSAAVGQKPTEPPLAKTCVSIKDCFIQENTQAVLLEENQPSSPAN